MSPRTVFHGLLSVYVVYHVLAVLILPNPHSIVGNRLAGFFTPYANTLGLNTTWKFFAPNPTPNIFYEYEVISWDWFYGGGDFEGEGEFEDEGGFEDEVELDFEFGKSHRWPPDPALERRFLADNYNRLVYHSRFVNVSEERMGRFFIPWLCRKHPYAVGISVITVTELVPSIDRSRLDRGNFEDLTRVLRSPALRFDCPPKAQVTHRLFVTEKHRVVIGLNSKILREQVMVRSSNSTFLY